MFKTHAPKNRIAERIAKRSAKLKAVLVAAALLTFSAFTACGGGSRMVNSALPGSTQVQFRVGDAPADRVIAFEVSLASPITLHPSDGSAAVTVNLNKNRFELTHMS